MIYELFGEMEELDGKSGEKNFTCAFLNAFLRTM